MAEFETVSANGSLLYSEKNTYNGNGSLLKRITDGSTVVTEQTGKSVHAEYAYDALDRLLSETVDGITTSYTYDTMGNRVSKTEDGVVTTYIYDLCNKLLSEVTKATETKDEVVTTYLYDGIGNLLEKVTEDGSTTYTYDALHQLTKTVNADGTWQESTYDASGIRSMLSENGISTEYVTYNGLALTGYDTSGEQTEHYYYGTSLLAAELATSVNENKTGTNLYYYIKNSHGDVIGLSDNDGTLTETYTYDAFGTLTAIKSLNENGILTETETAISRFLYAGEQYDSITELYYLRARRYDTTAGRFTQEDTYLGDGRNLYVYVGNNPLRYVDPSGHAEVDSLDSGADMDPMDDQKSITPSGGGDYNSRGANSGIQSGTTSGVTNGKCSGSKGFSFKGSSGVSTGRSSGLNSKVSISALRGKLRVSPPATVKSVKTTLGNIVFSVKSGSNTVNPNAIRFSQSSVNGSAEIVESMRNNGWVGDPIDVVRMSDGGLTTIDNTRVVSARQAGIDVQANIHAYDDLLPVEYIDRFTTSKGVPTTWGDVITLRIGKQNATFRNTNPFGSINMDNIK